MARHLKDGAVELVDYDPEWREVFETEGIEVLEALGDSCRDVAHIGSTAVEGMVARPIVDIMAGVDALEAAAERVVGFQTAEYAYLGDAGISNRLFFRKREARRVDVWVVLYQGDHWRDNILFRDYLREHPDEADRYAERKRDLVASAEDAEAYDEAKGEVIASILKRAREWRNTG